MRYWSIVYRSAWIVLAILFVSGIVVMFWPQFHEYKECQRREAELQAEISREKKIIQRLRQQQERFPDDPEFVEHIAHEMGMVKSNEFIYTFVDDDRIKR